MTNPPTEHLMTDAMDVDETPYYPTCDPISKGQLATLPTEIILEVAFYLQEADICHYAAITTRNWNILRKNCHREALRVALPTPEEYVQFEKYLTVDENTDMRQTPHLIWQQLVNTDIDERSKFVTAIVRGHVHAVKSFLGHGVDPNAYSVYGNRTLTLANSCFVPIEMTQVLLSHGADPNLANPISVYFTPLYVAAKNAQDGLARLLMSYRADVNQQGILHILCHLCNKDTVQNAIDRGADPHQRDRAGNTVVHSAAKNENPDVLILLFDLGIAPAHLEVRNRAGKSPLMKAVKAGRLRNMSLLLDHGADPDASFTNGTTALHTACRLEHVEEALLLIEAGANVNAIGGDGKAPLHFAAVIPSIDLVRRLVQKGANISVTDPQMNTPLHVVCYHTDHDVVSHDEILELVQFFVSAGAPTMARSAIDQTPVSIVLANDQLELAHIMITNNAGALDGETPGGGRDWSDYLRRNIYQSLAP
jgi:ankyrin repeat protein